MPFSQLMKGLWEMNCCIRMASEPVNFIKPDPGDDNHQGRIAPPRCRQP